jgi:hypothetical protein
MTQKICMVGFQKSGLYLSLSVSKITEYPDKQESFKITSFDLSHILQ